MQLLFERSFEYGEHEGLGLIPGEVMPLAEVLPAGLKVPTSAGNRLELLKKDDPLFRYTGENDYVYYVHSFYAARCGKARWPSANTASRSPGRSAPAM